MPRSKSQWLLRLYLEPDEPSAWIVRVEVEELLLLKLYLGSSARIMRVELKRPAALASSSYVRVNPPLVRVKVGKFLAFATLSRAR